MKSFLNRFTFIWLGILLVASESYGMKILKCRSYPPNTHAGDDYPVSFALGGGMISLWAECKDFQDNDFHLKILGVSGGLGVNIATELSGFEMNETFYIHCPLVRKKRFKTRTTYLYSGVQLGLDYGGRIGAATNIYGGACFLAGVGNGIMGALAHVAALIIEPIPKRVQPTTSPIAE